MPTPTAHRAPVIRWSRRVAIGVAAVALVAVLAGCSAGGTSPSAASREPATSSSATASGGDASPTPVPTLAPGGAARQNLPIFTHTVEQVWTSSGKVQGRAYIDALVAAGFEKSAMQVTNDTSTVGNPAESIEFSVRIGDQCLVGQVGPAIGDPVTTILPVLGDGTCLLGNTRPIDW